MSHASLAARRQRLRLRLLERPRHPPFPEPIRWRHHRGQRPPGTRLFDDVAIIAAVAARRALDAEEHRFRQPTLTVDDVLVSFDEWNHPR